ncbi:MAG: phage holin family protein [Lactobacillales bacterium]|jgi:uncharacterized membrane protein YvlD (DUF360 family)|nr:phage holin family protein [Lactobacillales bacterium]
MDTKKILNSFREVAEGIWLNFVVLLILWYVLPQSISFQNISVALMAAIILSMFKRLALPLQLTLALAARNFVVGLLMTLALNGFLIYLTQVVIDPKLFAINGLVSLAIVTVCSSLMSLFINYVKGNLQFSKEKKD